MEPKAPDLLGTSLWQRNFSIDLERMRKKGGIYLLQDEKLVGLTETRYEGEGLLQKLLADYPDLLVGDQVDSTSPRRWLLVSREAAIPSEEGGSGRWSLDHLFLDQDGVPTLVEVKRSTDSRIRREVVGQMLDYAANAVVYWPADSIRAQFEKTTELRGDDPEQTITDFLADGSDPEIFWQSTKLNLQAGRIRMIFVADLIPLELRRIVEFLNGQMDPAQVLAIEVRQYRSNEGLIALVPSVVGQTAAAQQSKSAARSSRTGSWDRASFMTDLGARTTPAGVEAMLSVFAWAEVQNLHTIYGKGTRDGSVRLTAVTRRGAFPIVWAWSGGEINVSLTTLAESAPFTSDERKTEIVNLVRALPGARFTPRSPNAIVSGSQIAQSNAVSQLIDVLQAIVNEVSKESD